MASEGDVGYQPGNEELAAQEDVSLSVPKGVQRLLAELDEVQADTQAVPEEDGGEAAFLSALESEFYAPISYVLLGKKISVITAISRELGASSWGDTLIPAALPSKALHVR